MGLNLIEKFFWDYYYVDTFLGGLQTRIFVLKRIEGTHRTSVSIILRRPVFLLFFGPFNIVGRDVSGSSSYINNHHIRMTMSNTPRLKGHEVISMTTTDLKFLTKINFGDEKTVVTKGSTRLAEKTIFKILKSNQTSISSLYSVYGRTAIGSPRGTRGYSSGSSRQIYLYVFRSFLSFVLLLRVFM